MSDRKLAKAVQFFFQQLRKTSRKLSKGVITWLLRGAFVANRRRQATAGFVLPTTVLLLLVVSLTAGAITYRAFNSSKASISEGQNKVVYNAASPAIDRARAKIEYLFDAQKENRYPGGVPSEDTLAAIMLGGGTANVVNGASVPSGDPYTLPGETRIDINGGGADNAWMYEVDLDGDGATGGAKDGVAVYSVIFNTPADTGSGPSTVRGWQRLIGMSDTVKAAGEVKNTGKQVPFARTGPLSNNNAVTCGTSAATTGTTVEGGWYEDAASRAFLRKRFQVDAIVIPNSSGKPGVTNNFATLEFQQDRQLDRGNKWGAWFRYDLEVFPGPPFNWNGAMHTEGNLILGNSNFNAFLISSRNSCLFYPSASEITITRVQGTPVGASNPTGLFRGLAAAGLIGSGSSGYQGTHQAQIHIQSGTNYTTRQFNSGNDAVAGTSSIYTLASNPTSIQTENGYSSRNAGDRSNASALNNNFKGDFPQGGTPRIILQEKQGKIPYVDDTYRADDRWGPKQVYNSENSIPNAASVGEIIPSSNSALVGNDVSLGDDTNVGLDGYWERRARNQGMRIIVGERLELGDFFGWKAPIDTNNDGIPEGGLLGEGDPLYPPYLASMTHEQRQRRSLRDNPSAVQSAAVYHSAVSKDYPIACIANVAHPGSPFSLQQSINFVPTVFKRKGSSESEILLTDFFSGRGTNGWEFAPYGYVNPSDTAAIAEANFATAINSSTSSLRKGLQNLAYFAGDPDGAFPPEQRPGEIHPDPYLTMWGNFSNLRRTLTRLGSTPYANLSPADKTTLHTASCTLGMLAYNVEQVLKFDPANPANDYTLSIINNKPAIRGLAEDMLKLMDGTISNDRTNDEVLPKERLATYNYDAAGSLDRDNRYNPRDYDRVPPEAFLAKLLQIYTRNGQGANDPRYRLAVLIHEHFQVRRDRTYGFRPSPAANTWNYNPYIVPLWGGNTTYWSSACDPNSFVINSLPGQGSKTTGKAAALMDDKDATELMTQEAKVFRLALSRLCGTVIPSAATFGDTTTNNNLFDGTRQTSGARYTGLGDINFPIRAKKADATFEQFLLRQGSTLFEPSGGDQAKLRLGYYPSEEAAAGAAGFTDAERPFLFKRGTGNPFTAGAAGLDAGQNVEANDNDTPTGGPWLPAMVAPKFPSLYYLFPQFTHDHDGGITTESDASYLGGQLYVDHRQPGSTAMPADSVVKVKPFPEPYITKVTVNSSASYEPVDTGINTTTPIYDWETGASEPDVNQVEYYFAGSSPQLRYRAKAYTSYIADRPISSIVLKPRKLPSAIATSPFTPAEDSSIATWKLPVITTPASPDAQNTPPNRITAANGVSDGSSNLNALRGVSISIPFLDRVMFDGREWQPLRVLDIDIGMLRRNKPGGQDASTGNKYAPDDVWLPGSGLVYAFREDAVREDAIARPGTSTAVFNQNGVNVTQTDLRDANAPKDPALASTGLSMKAVDFTPDPDRRPHGFRLRNGTQVQRHKDTMSGKFDQKENIRGISFFTDNIIYILGDFNLHQPYGNFSNEDGAFPTTFLEEFQGSGNTLQNLTAPYTEAQFYNRTNPDPNFAKENNDRWRPSEILADSTGVISNNFCDGSIRDTFQNSDSISYAGTEYNGKGLYGPGCANNRATSFNNQNRPNANPTGHYLPQNPFNWELSTSGTLGAFATFPNAYPSATTDVAITRNGDPVTAIAPVGVPSAVNYPAERAIAAHEVPLPTEVPQAFPTGSYRNAGGRAGVQPATSTRVNTVLISGLVPSRAGQSYGGLHNFPRFMEIWQGAGANLRFSGSFIQLSFSNYATGPWDMEAWEPTQAPDTGTQTIGFYGPPERLWGYDVALQLAPAGPVVSRLITPGNLRNEFYNEPAVNDPYIKNLCNAAKAAPGSKVASVNCPA